MPRIDAHRELLTALEHAVGQAAKRRRWVRFALTLCATLAIASACVLVSIR